MGTIVVLPEARVGGGPLRHGRGAPLLAGQAGMPLLVMSRSLAQELNTVVSGLPALSTLIRQPLHHSTTIDRPDGRGNRRYQRLPHPYTHRRAGIDSHQANTPYTAGATATANALGRGAHCTQLTANASLRGMPIRRLQGATRLPARPPPTHSRLANKARLLRAADRRRKGHS